MALDLGEDLGPAMRVFFSIGLVISKFSKWIGIVVFLIDRSFGLSIAYDTAVIHGQSLEGNVRAYPVHLPIVREDVIAEFEFL